MKVKEGQEKKKPMEKEQIPEEQIQKRKSKTKKKKEFSLFFKALRLSPVMLHIMS